MKNIYRSFLIIVLVGFSISSTNAQTVMLEQDVNADTLVPKSGKNRQNYSGSFFDLGFSVGDATGDSATSVLMGKSWSFKYGQYYKLRVNNFYSILGQVAYKRSAYYFEVQDPMVSNKLVMNNVMGEFSNRFNFGKRGDFIGYYLELGASADYAFMTKMKTTSETTSDIKTHSKEKHSFHGLESIEPLSYNAHARIGFNKFVIYGDYRLTDRIKTDQNYQLPPLTVGLRFDFGA